MTGRSTLLSLFLQPDTVGQLSARTFLLSGVCVALLGSIKLCILPMYNGNPEGGLSERLCLCLRLRTCHNLIAEQGCQVQTQRCPKWGEERGGETGGLPGQRGGEGVAVLFPTSWHL